MTNLTYTFTLAQLLYALKSLEPVQGSEYERGASELIGRALLDCAGYGEGTGENAELVRWLVRAE